MAEAPNRPVSGVSRRNFVKTVGSAALAVTSPLILPSWARADESASVVGPTPKAPAETAVSRFFATLKDEQRKEICFPFDHPKRSEVQNNWAIVKPSIDDMTTEQQALCQEIFKGLCSDEGYERFTKQMDDDAGGLKNYHVAVFGEPGTDKPFEWVLTGRHNTLRADGNSVEGAAFGGPIFYGHDATGSGNDDAQHTDNVWWYQGKQANAIFATLDDKEKARALITKAEPDAPRSIKLQGERSEAPGLPVAELDGQQKQMVQKLLKDLTSPFRAFDVEEVNECLKENGGADKLRLTYYKDGDIGGDQVWDIWKLEGPAFAWYFHGSPHVHTWVNIARKA
ncbi:DUF3500 domain-containing protein [Tundrisphaera lichenicola]|uniref:DUF3500 domain-containing protein n=1 Tax=Tundrisphaera lichenicola TaxID=2029860 RepID=UPI003EBA0B31